MAKPTAADTVSFDRRVSVAIDGSTVVVPYTRTATGAAHAFRPASDATYGQAALTASASTHDYFGRSGDRRRHRRG